MMLDIVDVKPLDDYRLELTFEDAQRRVADIASLVTFTGVFEPLRDPDYFRQVRVNPDVGTIVWPNGAVFCLVVHYEHSSTVRAALGECRAPSRWSIERTNGPGKA